MLESHIRGLIAITLILAVIPFINFFFNSYFDYRLPVFIDQGKNTIAIEIADKDQSKGIYFTPLKTTTNQLLASAGISIKAENDFLLTNGMKLVADSNSSPSIVQTEIDNSQRLALGIPIDLNSATENDLLLIPGIGEITAKKILKLRYDKVHFQKIEELMETKGIKNTKLAKLKPYLHVQKQR
jgi:competence protein ComEA